MWTRQSNSRKSSGLYCNRTPVVDTHTKKHVHSIHAMVYYCSMSAIAHSVLVHTSNVCMAQVTWSLDKAVSHQKLPVQDPPSHSTDLSGIDRGRQQGPAALSCPPLLLLLLLAKEHCSQSRSLLCLVSCHPLSSCILCVYTHSVTMKPKAIYSCTLVSVGVGHSACRKSIDCYWTQQHSALLPSHIITRNGDALA